MPPRRVWTKAVQMLDHAFERALSLCPNVRPSAHSSAQPEHAHRSQRITELPKPKLILEPNSMFLALITRPPSVLGHRNRLKVVDA